MRPLTKMGLRYHWRTSILPMLFVALVVLAIVVLINVGAFPLGNGSPDPDAESGYCPHVQGCVVP